MHGHTCNMWYIHVPCKPKLNLYDVSDHISISVDLMARQWLYLPLPSSSLLELAV